MRTSRNSCLGKMLCAEHLHFCRIEAGFQVSRAHKSPLSKKAIHSMRYSRIRLGHAENAAMSILPSEVFKLVSTESESGCEAAK